MREHYHTSLENVLVYGISAILVINLIQIGSGWLVKSSNPALASVGKATGALVSFGGN